MLSPYTMQHFHASAYQKCCIRISEEKLIIEQAVVKWILASLCQPSKLGSVI